MSPLDGKLKQVLDTLGNNGIVTISDTFIDVSWSSGKDFIKVFVEPSGWDIYTARYGMLWSGELTEQPPPDVIEQVKNYLSTFDGP